MQVFSEAVRKMLALKVKNKLRQLKPPAPDHHGQDHSFHNSSVTPNFSQGI